jgi:hypothetical protein
MPSGCARRLVGAVHIPVLRSPSATIQLVFGRVAELVAEIVGHAQGRGEAVGVVAEAEEVHALELDREVGGAAVVLRIEAVGLAAGGAADQVHRDARAAQAVDDRLARRAGVAAGEHEHAARTEVGQALAARAAAEALRHVEERGSCAPNGLVERVAVVVVQPLEELAAGLPGPGDHVGQLGSDVEVAAAVVADVEHQVGHRRGLAASRSPPPAASRRWRRGR